MESPDNHAAPLPWIILCISLISSQSQIQESLTEEQAARSESESAAEYQQQQHACATRELSYLQASLAEERTYSRQLKGDISVLEVRNVLQKRSCQSEVYSALGLLNRHQLSVDID